VPPMRTAKGGDRSVNASTRAAPTKPPKSETAVPTDHSQIRAAYPAPSVRPAASREPPLLLCARRRCLDQVTEAPAAEEERLWSLMVRELQPSRAGTRN
jgi:hypothetical protein